MRKLIAGIIGIVLATVCIIVLSVQPKVYFGATSEAPQTVETTEELASLLQSLPAVSAYYNAAQEDGPELVLDENFKPVTIKDNYEVTRYYRSGNGDPNNYEYDVENNRYVDTMVYSGEDITKATTTIYYLKDSVLYHVNGTITTGSKTEYKYYSGFMGDYNRLGGKYVYNEKVMDLDGYVLVKGGKVYLRYDKYKNYLKKYSVDYTVDKGNEKLGDPYDISDEGIDPQQAALIDEINANWLGVWYAADHTMSEKDQKKLEELMKNGGGNSEKDYEEAMMLQLESTVGESAGAQASALVTISDALSEMFNKIGAFIATVPEDVAKTNSEIATKHEFEDLLGIPDGSCHELTVYWMNPYSPSISYEIVYSSGSWTNNSKAKITINNIGNTGISMSKEPTKDIWDVAKPALKKYVEDMMKEEGGAK